MATKTESETAQPKAPRADLLYQAHPAVPAPAPSCVQGTALPPRGACSEPRADLAEALAQPGAERDSALAALERCDAFETGLIRALRADLGPAECADVLVDGVVSEQTATTAPTLPRDIQEALVGLGLAARLRRLALGAPAAPAARDKATLELYYKDTLFPWIEQQAAAIYVMSAQGKALHGYGKGLVAIEAGNADMRFVEIARAAPIAEEIAKFPEAKDVYYATLDERLEPRKGRGSAAALVGLREMAQLGVRSSDRVSSARELLSRAYGGRRINALDSLLVPPVPAEVAADAAAAIASRVPTVYATALVGPTAATEHLVRAHLQMGMPAGLRREVETGAAGEGAQFVLARALFEQGRTYFRAQDFQDASQLLTSLLDSEPASEGAPGALRREQQQQAMLLRALCVALLAGPKDAAEMIAQGPRFADALGNLVLLDGIATSQGPEAGRAAFNAAYLRELVVTPTDPDAWSDLSRRYAAAAARLTGNEAKLAQDRAQACREIERTIRAQAKQKTARATTGNRP
ncbi:MAG TPA: hypothetical protein VN764_09085, partial [Polyangiaceae bacterium]|nr:hypothetical protein [Polyangiaceae bacterium]